MSRSAVGSRAIVLADMPLELSLRMLLGEGSPGEVSSSSKEPLSAANSARGGKVRGENGADSDTPDRVAPLA